VDSGVMSVTLCTTTEPSFQRALFFIIVRFRDWIFTFLLRVGSVGCFVVVSCGYWSLVLVSWFQQIQRWFNVLCSGFLVRRFMCGCLFTIGHVLVTTFGCFCLAWCFCLRRWCTNCRGFLFCGGDSSFLLVSPALFVFSGSVLFVFGHGVLMVFLHRPLRLLVLFTVQVLFFGDWCTVLALLETWSRGGQF
jgi:hypothetical protein